MKLALFPFLLGAILADNKIPDDPFLLNTRLYFSIARGAISGYAEGMYKQMGYKLSPACLNENIVQNVFLLYSHSLGQVTLEPTQQFILLSKTYLLFLKDCPFDEALVDWTQWQIQNDLSMTGCLKILLSKVFQVTLVINDVAEVTAVMPTESDLQGNFELARRLGVDWGKVLRYATNFDPAQLKKPVPV